MTTGKTKITTSGFLGGMFNGSFFKPQSIVSNEDIAALNAYNTQISQGVPHLDAFDNTMKNTSITAQQFAKSAKGAVVNIDAIPKASKAAAAGLKLLSVAGNMLLYWAIAKGIQWIFTFNERLEESRQKMIEAGREAAQLTDDLGDLIEGYRKLGADGELDVSDREQAYDIQQQINKLLGDEVGYINLANGNYKDQLELLRKIQYEKAKDKNADIGEAKDASEEALRASVGNFSVASGNLNFKKERDAVGDVFKELLEQDPSLKPHLNFNMGSFTIHNNTSESIVKSYEKMIVVRDKLYEQYYDEIQAGGDLHDFYESLKNKISKMSEAVQKYKDAMSDYNINKAVITFNETEFEVEGLGKIKGAFIDSEEAMSGWIAAMINSEDVSDGVQAKIIGLAQTWYPQYTAQINEAVEAEAKKVVQDALADKSLDGNIEGLKKEASALGITEGAMIELVLAEIRFNKNNLDVSQKITSLKELAVWAGVAEKKIDSIMSVDGSSSGADKKVWAERNNFEVLGIGKEDEKWVYDGKEYYSWAYRDKTTGEIYDDVDSANAVLLDRAIQEETEKFGKVTIPRVPDDPDTEDKSDKNEALDNYLKDAENRYKIHQDETKYIQELQYAYDNLTKDEKERLDITGKINEAYRDLADNRIKDIEHQIDLVKELHGEDADVTGYYDQIQEVAHEEANRLRAMGYDDNSNEIQELQKKWWDAENGKLDSYPKQHENIIRDIEHARDMAIASDPFVDTTSYYKRMQEEYHKEAERLRAIDPEKYKEEIQELQKKWWDAEESIADWSYSNSERWINERNTYNDWELYGDNEIAAWERVLKRFQTEFPNELEKIGDIEKKIFELRKEEMEKSISDIEDYIKARNTYNDWDAYGDSELKAIKRITKIIENEYNQRLISREEYVEKLEEQSQRIYSLAQSEIDKNLSNIDKYISARNHYNDWEDFGDSEIEAIKRQIQYLDAAYEQKLISYEDYTERVAEYTQKLYSVAKDNIVEEVSELIKDYEDIKNLESSQLESQKTLLQSYYNVTNAVAEAQHEINKELNASQSMYEYLNEETRELLFNQDDYNALNKELLDIQIAADALQKQYQEDILNANAETISEITSQYQTQYETMMKQYEIAKAELEVAKKRQKLDNVLAERNTRMFINGQWQWVAKTQDVIDAQNELAEAEIERKKQEASLEQTEAINDFTAQINSLKTDLNKVKKWWSDMQEMLNGESDEVAKVLKEISKVSSPELKRVIEATGGSITSFSGILSESTETMSDIIDGDRSFGTIAGNIGTIIDDLKNYSSAIKTLTAEISGNKVNTNYVQDIIAEMKANSEKWLTASEDERKELEKANQEKGASIGASFDSASGKWYDSSGKLLYSVSASSSGNSSSSSSKTPSSNSSSSSSKQVNTTDQYVKDSSGYIQSNPNWDGKTTGGVGSFYKYAVGTRYTRGGLTAMGEEGFEAFITNGGRLIPINQPTIGNIGAGGIVFNREQMANLRGLWDLSNLGKASHFVSSSNINKQDTIIDNSIHINGLTVGEQGNEDWINGLRRYVATHK